MAGSVVQTSTVSNTATSNALATTTGSSIVLRVSGFHSSGYSSASVTDNKGNGAYSLVKRVTQGVDTVETWVKHSATGGAGHTVTITPTQGSSNSYANVISECAGLAGTTRDSGGNNATATATTANVTTDSTLAQVGDLIVAQALVNRASDSDVGWGANATTGYANDAQYPNYTANTTLSADSKVAAGSGSQTANWTHDDTSGVGNGWLAAIVVFAAAGAGDTLMGQACL